MVRIKNIDSHIKTSKFLAIIGSIIILYLSVKYYLIEGYTVYLISIITSVLILIYFILNFIEKRKYNGKIIIREPRWYCLSCNGHFSVEKIDKHMKCPNCGCTDFNVKIELKKDKKKYGGS